MLSDINEVTAPVGGTQGSSEAELFPGLAWSRVSPGAHVRGCACVVCTPSSFLSSDESFNTKSCSLGCRILHSWEATCSEHCIPIDWKVKFSTGRHFILPSEYLLGPGWVAGEATSQSLILLECWVQECEKSIFSSLRWIPGSGGMRRPVGEWLFYF